MFSSLAATILLALAATPAPARIHAGSLLGRIEVPKIHLVVPLTQGGRDIYTDPWPVTLDRGPAHEPDTALPWQPGVVGVAGHRTTFTHPFRWLNRVRRGDLVVVRTRWAVFRYRVTGSRVVLPTNVRILRRRFGHWLVMTACTPPGFATYRIAVTARLTKVVPS